MRHSTEKPQHGKRTSNKAEHDTVLSPLTAQPWWPGACCARHAIPSQTPKSERQGLLSWDPGKGWTWGWDLAHLMLTLVSRLIPTQGPLPASKQMHTHCQIFELILECNPQRSQKLPCHLLSINPIIGNICETLTQKLSQPSTHITPNPGLVKQTSGAPPRVSDSLTTLGWEFAFLTSSQGMQSVLVRDHTGNQCTPSPQEISTYDIDLHWKNRSLGANVTHDIEAADSGYDVTTHTQLACTVKS